MIDAVAGTRRQTIHAFVRRGERRYYAECVEIAVVTQGDTLDETAANLREAVALHLEGEDLEALGLAADPVLSVTFELEPIGA
ncbi:MAG TPA: type II toxin-antitoxin system HicB family antitoxin [Chloroflexota bacterium]|nr:type II toxin-antitoxin system HicB family antitoxin [Chloroflexota bacterium]